MANKILCEMAADDQVKRAIHELIEMYEANFPGRIAGYYVEGSYADHTSVSTSDVDIVIVFRERFADEQMRRAAEQLWESLGQSTTLELDIMVIDEDSLHVGVRPQLKLGSRLIYGEDVCQHYPLIGLDDWAFERMNAAYWLSTMIYHRPLPVRLPLDFPDSNDEFFGYFQRTVILADGTEVPCTRDIIRTTGWAATALLALRAGQYAYRKRDCYQLYRQHIGDEWSELLEDIYVYCRGKWNYLIPAEREDRLRLRAICERVLDFERAFLRYYSAYLLTQFSNANPINLKHVLWVQEQVPLADDAVINALHTAKMHMQ
jgi:predicted nucleotidyltransferase